MVHLRLNIVVFLVQHLLQLQHHFQLGLNDIVAALFSLLYIATTEIDLQEFRLHFVMAVDCQSDDKPVPAL